MAQPRKDTLLQAILPRPMKRMQIFERKQKKRCLDIFCIYIIIKNRIDYIYGLIGW